MATPILWGKALLLLAYSRQFRRYQFTRHQRHTGPHPRQGLHRRRRRGADCGPVAEGGPAQWIASEPSARHSPRSVEIAPAGSTEGSVHVPPRTWPQRAVALMTRHRVPPPLPQLAQRLLT